VFLYLGAFRLGAAIIAAHGYSFGDSVFEFASALGTVGLSVGVTAADAPAGVLWAEIGGMILGRLEFFAVLVGVLKMLGDGAAAVQGRERGAGTHPPVATPPGHVHTMKR
jgi:trk system potassium uptake protein TrkH